jgi:hypothetical protein
LDEPDLFEIDVSPDVSLPSGRHSTGVEVIVITPKGERLRGGSFVVECKIIPEFGFLPNPIMLGAMEVGDSSDAVTIIETREVSAFTVINIDSSDPDVKVEPTRQDGFPLGTAYRVHVKAAHEGHQRRMVNYTFKKQDGSVVVVPLEVLYTGLAPRRLRPSK